MALVYPMLIERKSLNVSTELMLQDNEVMALMAVDLVYQLLMQ
jgi:hypothetical protein